MKNVKRFESTDENVFKYVFDFDTAVAESVLYRYPTFEDRTVICCSTQSGCPIGCRFCGAGDYFVRNLTSDEIIEQVQYCFDDNNIDPSKVNRGQIMFMSMGEPLLNFNNVEKAIRKLNELYPTFALLISTSAPAVHYSALLKLSKDIDKVGLQFSIHESTDEARNELIPFQNKLRLAEISGVGYNWHMITGRQPFFNYCAHENNTSVEDVERLARLFNPSIWQATISVICERDESMAQAHERQLELATSFMQKLNAKGYSTRTFNPAGQDDIGGGCGQLFYVQDWFKQNPTAARPSCGNGLDIIHMPQ